MKKIVSLFAASVMIAVVSVSLTGCGEKKDDSAPVTTEAATTEAATTEAAVSDNVEYIGYQYSGKDPWGGEISVTLREEKDGKLSWTYTDTLPENIMVYQEVTSDYSNGYTEFNINGDVSDKENTTYEYAGNLKLQGGGVELTYKSGAVTTHSTDGDSNAYQVGPLLDNGSNTVFLEKKGDNK